MNIKFTYRFEAAHRFLKSNSKCSTPHGHTWYATLLLESKVHELSYKSMVEDFSILKSGWREFVEEVLDHSYMHNREDKIVDILKSESPQLRLLPFPGDPTTELVCLFCFHKMEVYLKSKKLDHLVAVKSVLIQETPTNAIELVKNDKDKFFDPYKKIKAWWSEEDIQSRLLEL